MVRLLAPSTFKKIAAYSATLALGLGAVAKMSSHIGMHINITVRRLSICLAFFLYKFKGKRIASPVSDSALANIS